MAGALVIWGCYRRERRDRATGLSPLASPWTAANHRSPPPWTWAEHRAGRRGCHRAKRGKGSEATLTAPAVGATIIQVKGEGARSWRSRQPVRSFRSYVAGASGRRASRRRRSHANDVNPPQPPHVHKPPAHKSPKRKPDLWRREHECDRASGRSPARPGLSKHVAGRLSHGLLRLGLGESGRARWSMRMAALGVYGSRRPRGLVVPQGGCGGVPPPRQLYALSSHALSGRESDTFGCP